MNIRSAVLCVALALSASLLLPSAVRAEKWLQLSSEHFDMLSTSSEYESKHMLVKLEQFWSTCFAAFPQVRSYKQRPQIFLFDSEKDYKTHIPETKVEYKTSALFAPGVSGQRMIIWNHHMRDGLASLYANYARAIVAERTWQAPYYFSEGFSELLRTVEIAGDLVTIGKPIPRYVAALNKWSLIPLEKFFAATRADEYYTNEDKRVEFTGQAWLLQHYATLGNKTGTITTANLYKFMKLNRIAGMNQTDAFKQAFGMEYKDMEIALSAYARRNRFVTLTTKAPAAPIREKITCRAASDFEIAVEDTGVLLLAGKTPDAEQRLLSLADSHPDNPRIYEILGEAALRKNETEEAINYLRGAVERNSVNPLIHLALLGRMPKMNGPRLEYKLTEAESAEYRRMVDRAIEVSPDCIDAYEMLAIIECQSPDIRTAVLGSIHEAFPAAQDPNRMLMAFGIIYYRLKDYENADDAVNALLSSRRIPDRVRRDGENLAAMIAEAKKVANK